MAVAASACTCIVERRPSLVRSSKLRPADGGHETGLGSGRYRVPRYRHVSKESADEAKRLVLGQASGLIAVSDDPPEALLKKCRCHVGERVRCPRRGAQRSVRYPRGLVGPP